MLTFVPFDNGLTHASGALERQTEPAATLPRFGVVPTFDRPDQPEVPADNGHHLVGLGMRTVADLAGKIHQAPDQVPINLATVGGLSQVLGTVDHLPQFGGLDDQTGVLGTLARQSLHTALVEDGFTVERSRSILGDPSHERHRVSGALPAIGHVEQGLECRSERRIGIEVGRPNDVSQRSDGLSVQHCPDEGGFGI